MKSTIFIKHTGRDLCKMPFPSLLRRQEPGLKHSFSCLSILAKANMLKQLSCASGRAPCAGSCMAFTGLSRKKSFRRPACHACDYAALIVPTAVCICIGMHAVKRRNRTHEIHNLHKTHRPRSLQNALSVAPAQAGARPEAQLQLFEHFGESQHAQTTEAVLQARLLPQAFTRSGPSESSDGLRAMRTITLR